MNNVATNASTVNENPQSGLTQSVPILLQHPDGTDEFHLTDEAHLAALGTGTSLMVENAALRWAVFEAHRATCDTCKQPVLHADDCNVCIQDDEDLLERPLELLGHVGATKVSRHPGVVRFFHRRCDPGDITFWFPGEQFFLKQRRHESGVAGENRRGAR